MESKKFHVPTVRVESREIEKTLRFYVHLISNFMLHVDISAEHVLPKSKSIQLVYGTNGIKMYDKHFIETQAERESEWDGERERINKSDCVAHVTVL